MLESFANAWSTVKNGVVEAAAKAYINNKIASFGTVTKLEIDRSKRTMLVETELKGENSPVWIRVGSYAVTEREGTKYMTLSDVSASREWIGLAAGQYLAGRQIKIPEAASGLL